MQCVYRGRVGKDLLLLLRKHFYQRIQSFTYSFDKLYGSSCLSARRGIVLTGRMG
jgi:hypothetical protein